MKAHYWMAGLLAAYMPLALAQEVVVLGDSLSDVGQPGWNLKATYAKADGSLNSLYDEHIAKALGGTATASGKGGNIYAYSGGVVVSSNTDTHLVSSRPDPRALQTQLNDYLATGVKADALHIVWGGGNDMAAILTRAQTSASPTAEVLASTNAAAQASAQQWQTLKQAGVDLVVMPTVPNVVYTPSLFQQFGAAAAAGFGQQVNQVAPGQGAIASAAFNQAFQAASARLNAAQQTSQADFDTTRTQVLNDTAAAIYASPLGAALNQAGISQAAFNASLQQQYQSFTSSASAATNQLNSATTSALNQVGGNVVRLDTNTLFSDMLANPAQYGFNNTTGTACSGSIAATLCTPTDQAAADAKLFADGFHPGPKAHQIMADYLLATLQAPADMAALRTLGLQSGAAAADFVRQDSNRNRSNRQPARTLDAVAAYQHDTGGDGGNILHAGAKAQLNDAWQLGLVFSRQDQDQNSGHTRVNAKTNSATAVVRYDAPQWWAGSMMQINDADYSTRRHIRLGQAQLSQQGETGGSSLGAGVFGGHQWQFGQTRLSALADLMMVKGKVHGFAERSGGATQMQFDEQKYTSLRSGIGAEAAYQAGDWQPYAQLRWVKEWRNNNDPMRAGMNGSHFSVAAPADDRSWLNAQLGVQWQPTASPWRAFAAAGHDFARSGHSQTSLQVGVAAQF